MKRNPIYLMLALLTMTTATNAQQVIDLWDGNPPSENGLSGPENVERDGGWITNITKATLTLYTPPAASNTGMAVVVCPGGGYGGLAIAHEGTMVAEWLNAKGITAAILKYRMPNKHREIPLDDAWQAMRYMRSHAAELGIDPGKIGIAGFSAGGHLAATASTHFSFDPVSTRPDFSILFYPVISTDVITHGGSKANLLGDNPSVEDLHTFSNEKQVTTMTPPTLLLLSDDDRAVVPANSTVYYDALKANGIPAAMYVFPVGGHGWGMKPDFAYHREMLALLEAWLESIR